MASWSAPHHHHRSTGQAGPTLWGGWWAERGGAGRSTRASSPRIGAHESAAVRAGGCLVGTGRCPPPNPPRPRYGGRHFPSARPPDATKWNRTATGPKRCGRCPVPTGGAYKWAGVRPGTACAAAGSDLRRDEPPLLLPNELLTHPTPPPPDLVGLGSARPPRAAAAAAGEHPSPLLSFAPVREGAGAGALRAFRCLPACFLSLWP